ncbi:hypothetical protein PoB_002135300 [Plakobranchus ocellatus]|uniref:Uncharacterized protein n=1 Tax=Plakobranchus ocellatus TaxID=259542 RepID=A0AAV3ZJ63_9GAST|nr:hypothetical protein PoB_002135300 [Plakobranchus ocellatus]
MRYQVSYPSGRNSNPHPPLCHVTVTIFSASCQSKNRTSKPGERMFYSLGVSYCLSGAHEMQCSPSRREREGRLFRFLSRGLEEVEDADIFISLWHCLGPGSIDA